VVYPVEEVPVREVKEAPIREVREVREPGKVYRYT
jgi:hypothetical protein